jgi:hypothetical protein
MGKNDPKLPPDTEEAKALAEVAAKRFNRYQEVFVPLENAYIGDVMNVREQGTYETIGGLAAADYAREFAGANDQLADEMQQQGVDPNSGVFMGNSSALRKAQAMKQGLGVAGAKIANTTRFYDGLQGLIMMGQGQAGQSIGGLKDIATSSTEKAISDANTAFMNASGMRAGVGRMVGLAASPLVDKQLGKSAGIKPQPSTGANG